MKLQELKALHDLGLSLIYLRPRDKRPAPVHEKGWTTSPRKTWAQLKADFHPSYNVGVKLGEQSKLTSGFLCCIDVDIHDEAYRKEALAKLKEVIGDQAYPEVRSGSGNGSRHLYAVSKKAFDQIEIEKHKGKWEIVAYSNGRQMVLPPSVHPSGKSYVWRTPLDEGSLPVFDYRKLSSTADKPRESDGEGDGFQACDVDITRVLDAPTCAQITDGAGVEDRSASLLSIAMKMCRAGLSDNEILSVLSDENHWISGAAFDHTKSRSRRRAVKWLKRYTLEKARFETHPLRLFERPDYSKRERTPEKVKEERDAQEQEQRETLPDLDGSGKPRPTLRNVIHILEEFMGGGLVGFNEFSCRPYFLKDTLYGGEAGRELADKDDLALKHHIASHYRFEPSKEICFEAHTLLSHRHAWHPVKQYLEALEWDGMPRIDHWLQDAFRAQGPEDYLQAVSRKVLCAAVARIYEPGCKFDYMVVLEGNQGEGKSMGLRALTGSEWFADSLGDIHNKDVVDQMLGKWLIEIGELDAIRGREEQAVKAFITRQVDRVRLSYARRSADYPRQCIFIGSTNDDEYLTDETGNRRYWPVKVGPARKRWLADNRDQLWAEAKFRYELGEKLYLHRELEQVARGEQEKRFEVDDWEHEIKKIVDKRERGDKYQTLNLYQALTLSNGHPNMMESKRIGKIMARLNFTRTTRRIEGVVGKCWMHAQDVHTV